MPMTRIGPYRPPRPTIRELMQGRPAGADGGGIPRRGYLGRPPESPTGRKTGRRPGGARERARYSPGLGNSSREHM